MRRIFAALVASGCLLAARGQEVAGLWLGTLRIGPSEVRLALQIERSADGLTARIDNLTAAGVRLDGRAFRRQFDSVDASFTGIINESGTQIAGTWHQGVDVPMAFDRVEKLPEPTGPRVPQKPYPYDEAEVSYENRQARVKFAATLTLPRGGGPHPAVLLLTGSGPQDRDESFAGHKPFLVLADYLTRRGIAVLRADDRGVGASTGSVNEGTTDDFATDALAGVAFLQSRRDIDASRVGLVGHSEGGIVAALAAARSADVAFIVLMAGPGLPGDRIIAGQSYAGPKAMGASDEGASMNRDLALLMLDAVMREKDPAAAQGMFEQRLAALMKGWSEAQKGAMSSLRPQLQAQMRTFASPWFRTFLTLDPKVPLTKVKAPVLALNGDLDTQVLPRENLAAIVEALEAGGNKDYTVTRMPRLNHLFQTARTGAMNEYAQIAETIAPAALEVIGDWIAVHTRR